MANMAQAVRLALHYAETHLGVSQIFGQDVGPPLGGVFTATQGLKRAWSTPLDERGIVGAAIGIAMTGQRCVAEIQFADYIFNTVDLLKQAGAMLWSSRGQYPLPLVLMTPVGAGIHGSVYHSHSFESWASRLVGWKIVMPSTPLDAYGLLLSAIKDPDPVMVLLPKALMRVRGREGIPGEPQDEKELRACIDAPIGDRTQWKPRWPENLEEYTIPIGKGRILPSSRMSGALRSQLLQPARIGRGEGVGGGVTIITWGRMVGVVQEAIGEIASGGFSELGLIELIDLRSLIPYDWDLMRSSVLRTGRVLFVNEETEVTNFADHLVVRMMGDEDIFYRLQARPRVVATRQVPIGLPWVLESATVPGVREVVLALKEVLSEIP